MHFQRPITSLLQQMKNTSGICHCSHITAWDYRTRAPWVGISGLLLLVHAPASIASALPCPCVHQIWPSIAIRQLVTVSIRRELPRLGPPVPILWWQILTLAARITYEEALGDVFLPVQLLRVPLLVPALYGENYRFPSDHGSLVTDSSITAWIRTRRHPGGLSAGAATSSAPAASASAWASGPSLWS